jgi:hypothetical protein
MMTGNVSERLHDRAVWEGLPCESAFDLARTEGLAPLELGHQANESDIRIIHCQLGLFGYKAFGEKRLAVSLPSLPTDVPEALRAASKGDELPCAAAWRVAADFGLPRLVVGELAERIGLRIVRCQLGCF